MTMLAAAVALLVLASAAPTAQQDQAPQIADLYEPGQTAHWVVEAAGEIIGHHGSRYLGEEQLPGARAHHFEGQVELSSKTALGVMTQRYTGELWTDARGRPLRFVLQALVGASYSRVELAFGAQGVACKIVQGPTSRDVNVPLTEPAFVLANNFIAHFELLLALDPPPLGVESKRELFSANVLKTVPITFEHAGTFADERGSGVVLEDSLGERIELTDDGRVLDITIPAAKIVFRRVDGPFERIQLEPPAREVPSRDDLREEQVRIEAADAVLAGMLSSPADAEGRLPAVFFVSGSGSQDRNGFSSGIDVGTHEILDHLARAGFLVLRVDDRGAGASTGRLTGVTFDDLVADARACVDFLSAHERADPEHVFVIGHSEGGETAPLLAAQRPALAGIVLMAPPGRSVIEVIYEQNEAALRATGELDEDGLAETMAELRRQMGLFVSDGEIAPEELDENIRALFPNRPWFQSHAHQDPVANIRAVKCPVLILHGERDFQVSPERDSQPLAEALDAAGHRDHVLHVLPGLDHLFKRTPGEKSQLADYFLDRRVDAAFLELLAAWLTERAR